MIPMIMPRCSSTRSWGGRGTVAMPGSRGSTLKRARMNRRGLLTSYVTKTAPAITGSASSRPAEESRAAGTR